MNRLIVSSSIAAILLLAAVFAGALWLKHAEDLPRHHRTSSGSPTPVEARTLRGIRPDSTSSAARALESLPIESDEDTSYPDSRLPIRPGLPVDYPAILEEPDRDPLLEKLRDAAAETAEWQSQIYCVSEGCLRIDRGIFAIPEGNDKE